MKKPQRTCCECDKKLVKDEVALSQKLLGTEIDEFYCIDCLSKYLECSKEDLEIKYRSSKNRAVPCFFNSKEEKRCWKIKFVTYFLIWLF